MKLRNKINQLYREQVPVRIKILLLVAGISWKSAGGIKLQVWTKLYY